MAKGKKRRAKQQNRKTSNKQNVEKVENDNETSSFSGSLSETGLVSIESPSSSCIDRLPFASPTSQLLQQEKDLGITAHQNKSWELAEKHFTLAIQLAAESYQEQLPSLYSSIGLVHFYKKEYEKAIDFCNSSLKQSPQHWPAFICRSFAYSCLKNLPKAASDYDEAARILSRSNIPEKKLNRILSRAQQAALDTGAMKQKDKRMDVLEELGNLYFTAKTDVSTKDKTLFEELPPLIPVGEPLGGTIWNLNPEDLSAREASERAMKAKQKGNSAFNTKDWISALLHYSRAIRLNPNNAVFYSNRACVYLKLNRYYETISDCTASIKREPTIKAYARRGAARAALSEYQLACEDYLQALDFEPQNQSCLNELARCLCNIESNIVKRIEDLEKISTSATEIQQLKKKLMLVRKDIKNVGSRVKEPIKEKEKTITAEQSKQLLHRQIVEATKVLARDSCNSIAYLERALAHQSLGNYELAEKDYRDGLRVDPDNKELQKRLKFVLHLSKANDI